MPLSALNRRAFKGRHFAILCVGALALTGCASRPQPPTAQMAVAASSIDDAEHNGAVEYAPVELRQARDKYAAAQAASRNDNNVAAEQLASEAELDAKLARVTADAAHARVSANAVQQGNQTLRQETILAPQ